MRVAGFLASIVFQKQQFMIRQFRGVAAVRQVDLCCGYHAALVDLDGLLLLEGLFFSGMPAQQILAIVAVETPDLFGGGPIVLVFFQALFDNGGPGFYF